MFKRYRHTLYSLLTSLTVSTLRVSTLKAPVSLSPRSASTLRRGSRDKTPRTPETERRGLLDKLTTKTPETTRKGERRSFPIQQRNTGVAGVKVAGAQEDSSIIRKVSGVEPPGHAQGQDLVSQLYSALQLTLASAIKAAGNILNMAMDVSKQVGTHAMRLIARCLSRRTWCLAWSTWGG